MPHTQVEHNRRTQGGLIFPLLGAAASAILPTLIGRITGKGLFITHGHVEKVKRLGEGLSLILYQGLRTLEGMYLKKGGSYDIV